MGESKNMVLNGRRHCSRFSSDRSITSARSLRQSKGSLRSRRCSQRKCCSLAMLTTKWQNHKWPPSASLRNYTALLADFFYCTFFWGGSIIYFSNISPQVSSVLPLRQRDVIPRRRVWLQRNSVRMMTWLQALFWTPTSASRPIRWIGGVSLSGSQLYTFVI